MKKSFIAIIAVLMLVSCKTNLEITQTSDYMESSVRILEPENNMFQNPLIADLQVSETKIQYHEKELFAEVYPDSARLVEVRKLALSRAAQAYNADVLVCPTIDIVRMDERLEVTVSGYPAKYVKFRNVSKQDIEMLNKLYLTKSLIKGQNLSIDDIIGSPEKNLNVTTIVE